MDKLVRADQEPFGQHEGRMVRLRRGEEKPPNARILTPEEVLRMQQKTIMEWKPRYEMWPFSYGIGILGGASALTGIYINNFCRRQLGLMHIARLSTYFPTVALPVVISTLFHNMLVTNKILVGEFPCTVCAATRSGTIQSLAGALYPIVLGPLVCIANARKYNTYYIPGIRDAAEVLPFLRRIMPGPSVLLGLILANFAVGMAISERETLLFAKFLNPTTATLETEEEAPFQ